MWHKSITLLKVVVAIILSCTMTLLCIKFLVVIIYLVYAENIIVLCMQMMLLLLNIAECGNI